MTASAPFASQKQPQPYGEAALDLHARGLCPVPCRGADGKSNVLREHHKWKYRLSRQSVEEFAAKHPDANVGIITSLSGVTVIDVDDPNLLSCVLKHCGDTPLITQTPRGGYHAWYRKNGEQERMRLHGLPIDVKAGTGIVIVPPSFQPATGKRYRFYRGKWADLSGLPKITPNGLNRLAGLSTGPLVKNLRAVKQGWRNMMLFRECLRNAPFCDNFEGLLDVAETINENACDPRLRQFEVKKIARSVWRYQAEGRNWVGQPARAIIANEVRQALLTEKYGADALVLLVVLQQSHGGRNGPFAISAKAMAKTSVIPCWNNSPNRYRNAWRTLTRLGILRIVHQGGRRPKDPRLFVFGSLSELRVLKQDPI
jgi:Bifunctional DNA primase/polymerase, N-terminal/Primase C terminal 1 (PriCT-1)